VRNVAPYSYFNLMGSDPPYVAFGSTGIKDSLRNLREGAVRSVVGIKGGVVSGC